MRTIRYAITFLFAACFSNWAFPEVVSIPDSNLETAIRDALSKPTGDITDEDMATLTSFTADFLSITDLTGLESAVNLEFLRLFDNQISDLNPIANLTALSSLALDGNQISNLNPIANLTALKLLFLEDNQISDLNPIANLTALKLLFLKENQISDLNPIANLTALSSLGLDDNQISDLNPIANLTALSSLGLENNQISDLNPIANLTALSSLGLKKNRISDLNPIANLTALSWLLLSNNQISDLNPIANLTALSLLVLDGNQISDLNPIANLTALSSLVLDNNDPLILAAGTPQQKIVDAFLDGGVTILFDDRTNVEVNIADPNLKQAIRDALNKPNNPITYGDMATLTSLTANSLSISDLAGLESAVNLESLSLFDNQISDLGPLSRLTALESLNLMNNDPLILATGSPQQKILDELHNKGVTVSFDDRTEVGVNIPDAALEQSIRDVLNKPTGSITYGDMATLDELNVASRSINNLVGLQSAVNLVTLGLQGNQISDLAPLAKLTELSELDLRNNGPLILYSGSPQQAIVDAFIVMGVSVSYDVGVIPRFLSSYSSRIDHKAATLNIDVSTFEDWLVAEDAEWLSANLSAGSGYQTIELTVNENLTPNARSANVQIGHETHVVRQRGYLESENPTFESWIDSFFLSTEIEAMTPNSEAADFDRDGMSNKAEWRLNFDPMDFGSRLVTTFERSGTGLTLKAQPVPTGIEIGLASSPNLVDWTSLATTVSRSESAVTIEVENIAEHRFIQVVVIE